MRRLSLITAALALMLIAGACSSDNGSDDQTTTTVDFGPLTLSCTNGETTQSSRSFGEPSGPSDPVAAAHILIEEADSPDWWADLLVAAVRPIEGTTDLRVFLAQDDRRVQLIVEVRGPGTDGQWQAAGHAACAEPG